MAGLGKLVPIREIVAELEKKEKKGEILPGDKWLSDYRQWEEQIRDKEIDAKTPPPGELTAEEREAFKTKYMGILIPDLQRYVPHIYRTAFAGAGRLAIKDAVDLLFQYGCKRLGRLLPGFTRIVRKRINPEIDTVGDWNAPIDASALAKPEKKKSSGKGPPPYKPKPKPEVIEICYVTHKQLEATLKRDLEKLAQRGRAGAREPSTDSIQPISGVPKLRRSAPARGGSRAARRGRSRGARRGRSRAARTTRRPRRRRRTSRARRRSRSRARPRTARARPRPGRTPARRPGTSGAQAGKARALLFTDLGTYDKDLKGERFHDVAKRLLNFYRKAAGARNFSRAHSVVQGKVNDMATKVKNTPAAKTKEAREEMSHQAAPTTVDTRARREVLRRKVDQWTNGYEYEEIGKAFKGRMKKALGDYKKAEGGVLVEFWNDCEEIQPLCQDPRTQQEKDACINCARKIVRTYCIDGKKGNECSGGHTALVRYGR